MDYNNSELDISCIILTYNEEIHIERCIKNIQEIAHTIFVVDSISSDKTVEIATKLGATVIQHEYINQAQQFQWAIENLPIESEWVIRLDADEYLSSALIDEIKQKIPLLPKSITGCYLPRDVIFLGKNIKHGRISPPKILRLWRNGSVYMEQRWMDERLVLIKGSSIYLKNRFIDHNLNNLTWWTIKHNKYANREIVVEFTKQYGISSGTGSDQLIKRNSKKSKYYRLPLFLRAFAYFFIRYFIFGGWLDGYPGLIWATLQAYWYRFLIDAKIYEMKCSIGKNPSKNDIIKYFQNNFHININPQ